MAGLGHGAGIAISPHFAMTGSPSCQSPLASFKPFHGRVHLFAGSSHPTLARRIAHHLDMPLSGATLAKFSNGETRVEIEVSCRGCDAFVIQPICASSDGKLTVNDALMELLIFVSALRGSSAQRITAVVPLYGYSRQDKKDRARVAVVARLVASLLEIAGIDRVMAVELHADQIMGFFRRPLDNIYAETPLRRHIAKTFDRGEDVVVVTPHASGFKRAARIANKLHRRGNLQGAEIAVISKARLRRKDKKGRMRLVGNVRGKVAIIVDDLADTCKTLVRATRCLTEEGARCCVAYVTHGMLSGRALERLNNCHALAYVVVTNTMPQAANKAKCPKLVVVDVSEVIAAGIFRAHCNESISAMFGGSGTNTNNNTPKGTPRGSISRSPLLTPPRASRKFARGTASKKGSANSAPAQRQQ